jgi:hypothetical protein
LWREVKSTAKKDKLLGTGHLTEGLPVGILGINLARVPQISLAAVEKQESRIKTSILVAV